jgi:hypothetical protein
MWGRQRGEQLAALAALLPSLAKFHRGVRHVFLMRVSHETLMNSLEAMPTLSDLGGA